MIFRRMILFGKTCTYACVYEMQDETSHSLRKGLTTPMQSGHSSRVTTINRHKTHKHNNEI